MIKKNILIIFICFLLYLLNKVVYYPNMFMQSFMSSHFNDILCGILFPAYCNILLENRYGLINRLWKVESLLLVCGIFWEFIAPLFISYSVSDIFDIAAYMFGGFIYWIIYRIVISSKNHKIT